MRLKQADCAMSEETRKEREVKSERYYYRSLELYLFSRKSMFLELTV